MNTTSVAILGLILAIMITYGIISHNSRKRKEKEEQKQEEDSIKKEINSLLLKLNRITKKGNVSDLIDATIKLGEAKRRQKND